MSSWNRRFWWSTSRPDLRNDFGPVVDVIFSQGVRSPCIRCLRSPTRHPSGSLQGIRDRLLVVWVHQQRPASQFGCRARKFTQDQNSLVLHLRRAIFLGNQVHPIFQWSDQSDVRRAIVCDQFLARQAYR